MRRVAPLKKIEPAPGEEEIAPFFELPSTKGGTFNLRDYFQKRNVVLYFFEGPCPPCGDRLKALADDFEEFQRLDTEVAGISSESLETLKNLADSLNLPFALLSDQTGEVIRKYTGAGHIVPALFIIDRHGMFHRQEISDTQDALVEEEEILNDVRHVVYQCPECGVYG